MAIERVVVQLPLSLPTMSLQEAVSLFVFEAKPPYTAQAGLEWNLPDSVTQMLALQVWAFLSNKGSGSKITLEI